ncbi:hypothetical protein ACFUEN_44995 [Streptomyces griseorubiginosus]|uniref:hypothetical protein n=1 Tax=Streptomyces griseorubiginosus TaxID=67304 RepID=UPI00362559D2
MPSTRLPSAAGCTVIDAGRDWDAVRVPRSVGVDAMTILGTRCGAVVEDPLCEAVYYFVPVGTAAVWDVPTTRALGAGASVTIPPPRRTDGAGPHWRICPGDGSWLTDPQALQAALEDAIPARAVVVLEGAGDDGAA